MPATETAKTAARAYYESVMAATVCVRCRAQPVEWHHPDHALRIRPRVSKMVWLGWGIHRIAAEMALCTPLCRKCHMIEDGRAAKFLAATGGGRPPKRLRRCAICPRMTDRPYRGMCHACYERLRSSGAFKKGPTQ